MPNKKVTGQYLGSYQFKVAITTGNAGGTATDILDGFIRISGIVSETEEIQFKHGMDRVVRKAMGRTNWGEVTLERVYSGLDEFREWRTQIETGIEDRRTVEIFYLAPNGTTILSSYTLYNCWPKRWEMPPMDAGSSAPAIEKITLAVEKVIMNNANVARTLPDEAFKSSQA